MRIIVFSGFNQRAVIAFLRTLKKNNIDFSVIAISDEDLIFSTSYKNKVLATRKISTLDLNDIINCINKIKKETGEKEFFIVPSTEALNRFLLEHQIEFQKCGCTVPIVEYELYKTISDKNSFCEICKQNNISIPKEVEFKKENIPFVVKPKEYNIKNKINSPILVLDENIFNSIKYDDKYCYCQTFLTGKSYYLLYYFKKNGEFVKLIQQNYLQQENGKSIVLAEIVDKDLEFSNKFENLFKKIQFNGLVMIEIRENNGNYYMIEANPRFWGPSQLFVDYGFNLFEYFLADWGFDVKIKNDIKPAKYFWSGGLNANIINLNFPFESYDEFESYDVYKRKDTMNIYKKELIEVLIKKYSDISKHSQYQILSSEMQKYISNTNLNIKSRAEKERFEYITENVSLKNKTILDIGANTGYFSFEAIKYGARELTCYEGNVSHAEFIKLGIDLLGLNDKINILNEYYNFTDNKQYDVCFLLNVIHHLGDDYEDTSIPMEKAKTLMIQELNKMAFVSKQIVFQLGFNWKGNRNCCLFKNGLKSELIDFIKEGTKDFWQIKKIGIAQKYDDKIVYYDLNNENIIRNDSLGEFLNRPLFIMDSKRI